MIILSNVTKIFQQREESIAALSDINLHVPTGQIYGIIGASGAGKSTLIRCVNLLEFPSSGQVIVDGHDLTKLSKNQLMLARRGIGMIFQHFNLLNSRNVFGNVALPLELTKLSRQSIENRVMELLDIVGLKDKSKARVSHLSGGQKQRVAIARALANHPKVLLCDEATSALDPATTQSVLTLLKDINQRLGVTILLITHEMEVVKRICDQVAILDQGKLIEQGRITKIFSHPKQLLTQKLIQSTLHTEVPRDYEQRLSKMPKGNENEFLLLSLEFTGRSVDAPLLSDISRRFNISSNIISAQVDYVGGVKFGIMLTEMQGKTTEIDDAICYLQKNHVNVKVLGYV